MYFVFSGASGEPAAKKAKVEEGVDGGMADIVKAKVTEVGQNNLIFQNIKNIPRPPKISQM